MREEAKRRAELYQALADGKTLQVSRLVQGSELKKFGWCDLDERDSFELLGSTIIHHDKVRIKPEPKKEWYRVALIKDNRGKTFTSTADSTEFHRNPEKNLLGEWGEDFIKWLTDRIEYELPEGEA